MSKEKKKIPPELRGHNPYRDQVEVRGVNRAPKQTPVTTGGVLDKSEPEYPPTSIQHRPRGTSYTLTDRRIGLRPGDWANAGQTTHGTGGGIPYEPPKNRTVIERRGTRMINYEEEIPYAEREQNIQTRGVGSRHIAQQQGLDLVGVFEWSQSLDPVENLHIDIPPRVEPTRGGGLVRLQDSVEALRQSLDRLTKPKK